MASIVARFNNNNNREFVATMSNLNLMLGYVDVGLGFDNIYD